MSLVTPEIASIKAYVPGKPLEELERELGITGAIKLASNENPMGPSPRAIAAMREELNQLNFYPEGDAPNLKRALAAHLGVGIEKLSVGNGSNEIIELLIRTFTTPQHHAVVSDHAFLVYAMVLKSSRVPLTSVPMRNMTHDLVAMKAAIRPNTRLVFIANPNNPTGTYNTRAELEAFLDGLSDNVIVALDEAYFEYAEASDYAGGVELLDRHDNLVVLRTFSKCYGLAGIRIGYGVANAEITGYLNRVRQPFNTNRVGQVGALAALLDTDYTALSVATNNAQRAYLCDALAGRGIDYLESQTNFVLVKVPASGAQVTDAMTRKGVVIRAMGGYGLPEHVRVTVGTREQNDRFLTTFDDVLANL